MKILHVIPSYLPAYRYGGPIKSVHELNKWLVKSGEEVTVYTTDIDGKVNLDVPLNQPVMVDGVKVFYFPVTWRFWQYSSLMRRALRENIKDFDLVHITSVFLSASTLGACYAKKFHKPYIISPRGSLMKEPFHKGFLRKKFYTCFIEKRNLKNADAIHFTAELERDEYLSLGLPLRKALVVPNGLDFKEMENNAGMDYFRHKFNIPVGRKMVLFLSRLSWKKGLDDLIPAFAEVFKKDNNAVLVLAGGDDENYKKEVELLITNYQLQDKVIFTGMLPRDDAISAYKAADVFVLPSYAENFGIVVGEAMHSGLPVVITENVGIADIVKKYNAGIVIKKNKTELCGAIIKILENPKEAEKMGEKGREAVQKEFYWGKIAENFIKGYNEIIVKNSQKYGKTPDFLSNSHL